MSRINRKQMGIRLLALLGILVAAPAFSGSFGGDSFTIYLNNKLLVQQYVARHEGIKSLSLDQAKPNDQLMIYYSHCGRLGTGRSIVLKDAQNNTVKEWHFVDAEGANNAMTCRVKDILDSGRGNATINLYYSSRELPEGRLLASLQLNDGKQAFDKKQAPARKTGAR